jgi:HK97 family phage major capsid protein
MTLLELQEKRNKLLFDARAIMAGADVTTEQRVAVDKMLADANVIKGDIERSISLEAAAAELRSVPGRVPQAAAAAAQAEPETRTIEERRKATGLALRSFIKGQPFESRELTIAADGGVMIPVGVTDPKIALKSAGSVYDVVYKFRSTSGESVKVPLLNDLGNGFILSSAYAGATTDPLATGVTISIDDVQSNPIQIQNSLVNDVEFDIVGFLDQALRNRYLRAAANWITNGNTSNVGALATGYTGITGNTASMLKYVDFTGLLASLDPAYYTGANFLMSPATLANSVLNIVDSNNRPLFLPFADGGISGFAGTLFGYPVKLNPYQPAVVTGNVAVQFGDFAQGYTFREVLPGVVIKKSSDRYIELNALGVFAFARVGGAVTNPGAAGGTTQPVVSLTIK